MKRFMLLVREDLSRLENLTEQEVTAQIAIMTRWTEELAKSGNLISGDPLQNEGRLATANKVFSDGPFIEAREAVSGFMMIKATNIEQATDLALGCPLVQNGEIKIEVRPILEFA